MTWTEKKEQIVNILSSREYTERVENLQITEISQAFSDRAYSLVPSPVVANSAVGSRAILQTNAELAINYTVDSVSEFDGIYDEFISIITELLSVTTSVVIQPVLKNEVESNSRWFIGRVTFNVITTPIC